MPKKSKNDQLIMRNSSKKIAQFYVFQGKKNQNQTYFRSKKSKKYSIIRRQKNRDILKKILKTHLLSTLKFEKVTDNEARFE